MVLKVGVTGEGAVQQNKNTTACSQAKQMQQQ